MRVNRYSTLSKATQKLKERGYEAEFILRNGRLKNIATDKIYEPKDLYIVEYHRYEGQSKSGDTSIVFAIEGNDRCKGVVISSYGTYTDMKLVEFMDKVKIKERLAQN